MASKPYEPVEAKVAALLKIEELVDGGMKVSDAIDAVSKATGIAVRTLFRHRKLTNFVPRADWGKALARPPRQDRLGLQVECHPMALEAFMHLCRHGIEIAESYRRTLAEAKQMGWLPLPSERTLRRELERKVGSAEMRRARRNATV